VQINENDQTFGELVVETLPLLIGVGIILLGAGLHGTLLGVRASLEGFPTVITGIVMSAYFVGFLLGSHFVPGLVSKVGHIRTFAAIAAIASATVLLYGLFVSPYAWIILRIIMGICFSGMYVISESWLNDRAPNHMRGQLFSIYMVISMGGLAAGQYLLTLADPLGFTLFILISVLVSLAVVPSALSSKKSPDFTESENFSIKEVFKTSPLGAYTVGMNGVVVGSIFGMGAVYATGRGMALPEVANFLALFVFGSFITEWPVGWLSDRVSRRLLIIMMAVLAAAVPLTSAYLPNLSVNALYGIAFATGGLAMPLYSLGVSLVNDRLPAKRMVAASGGLIFINGAGAASGPLLISFLMKQYSDQAFFMVIGVVMASAAIFGIIRISISQGVGAEGRRSYNKLAPRGSAIALEGVAESAAIEDEIEHAEPEENNDEGET